MFWDCLLQVALTRVCTFLSFFFFCIIFILLNEYVSGDLCQMNDITLLFDSFFVHTCMTFPFYMKTILLIQYTVAWLCVGNPLGISYDTLTQHKRTAKMFQKIKNMADGKNEAPGSCFLRVLKLDWCLMHICRYSDILIFEVY